MSMSFMIATKRIHYSIHEYQVFKYLLNEFSIRKIIFSKESYFKYWIFLGFH